MDKHDRPYRCTHQECAKLQGFTYSGGLLRHEREVHGKHGGPKAALMCPFEDCKRHSGKGFTRKENLNEHIRRVHESKGQAASQVQEPSQSQFPDFGSELQEAAAGADQITEPPVARMYDDTTNGDLAIEPSLAGNKRKREDEDEENLPELNEEEMKVELKRLRSENRAKDHRLRMLEASGAMRDEQIKQLQETVNQLRAQSSGYGPFDSQIAHEQQLQHEQQMQQEQQMQHDQHLQHDPQLQQDQHLQHDPQLEQDQHLQHDPQLQQDQHLQHEPQMQQDQHLQHDPHLQQDQHLQHDPQLQNDHVQAQHGGYPVYNGHPDHDQQPAQQGGYVPYEGQSEHERDLQQLQPLQQVTQEHSNHV
ncbi:hypothetical protein KC316_g20422 [Hortaea werneckii]|nr:hypothetical protein KC316_g20422 [Hortaea werneckii]